MTGSLTPIGGTSVPRRDMFVLALSRALYDGVYLPLVITIGIDESLGVVATLEELFQAQLRVSCFDTDAHFRCKPFLFSLP